MWVISDFKMSGLNGMEFLKKIKDLNPYVRTILITAFQIDDKVFLDYTKKKIINSFLQKPICMHDLLREVILSYILLKCKEDFLLEIFNMARVLTFLSMYLFRAHFSISFSDNFTITFKRILHLFLHDISYLDSESRIKVNT